MLFNSLLFLFFFPIVTIGYYFIPPKFRWIWLLVASCYFYMYFKPVYILIILLTIVIDYCAGILIEKQTGKLRLLLLIVSLLTNIGILAFFKYFNFFVQNLNYLSPFFNFQRIPFSSYILPLGLSFHTFQAMSYTIEVYRGKQKAETHFGIYSLYVLFYPQMVAGPIERPQHILPQLHREVKFDGSKILSGLVTMSIGFFKKVVIADRLTLLVTPLYDHPKGYSSFDLLLATYFFAFQIYCDFSGYTDIAIGAAQTLGIKLMDNFNMPYLSVNVAEFWRRWHISLSTWFRDYLYIPLGGNRINFFVTCLNLLFVFTVSGLWHGASWKFIVWGLIHGLLLVLYNLLNRYNIKVPISKFLKWLITFNLVCFAWVFFRALNIDSAFYILRTIFSFKSMIYSAQSIMSVPEVCYCALLIAGLLLGEYYLKKISISSNKSKVAFIFIMAVACYLFGVFNEAQFIYFQF